MDLKIKDCYNRVPLFLKNKIPVFSETDFYVENYDRIAIDHLKHFEKTGHNPFMREDHWQEIESSTELLISKYVNDPKLKILDVGVGMGRLLDRFKSLDRFGMDIALRYLNSAKNKGIEVCMSRIEDMPYKEKYFDIVVTTDVLEHVLDLNLVLRNILGVVKEGGFIVVRVPYKENLSYYLRSDYPYDLVHLRNFDENSLCLLFEKIFNLKVIEWNLCGFRGNRFKVLNIKYLRGVLSRIMEVIRKINDPFYQYLCKKLCCPSEINMVIRNSKNDPERP